MDSCTKIFNNDLHSYKLKKSEYEQKKGEITARSDDRKRKDDRKKEKELQRKIQEPLLYNLHFELVFFLSSH